jgi:hypothetical protein
MTIYTHKPPCDSTKCSNTATDLLTSDNKYLKPLPNLRFKSQLNKVIVKKNNSPDHLAINIYWDTLCHLYKRGRRTARTNGLYLNYGELSETHGVPLETIRKKFVKLEQLGLINRSFQHGNTLNKGSSYNQLIIYVWKSTPHFFTPFGSDKEEITNLNPYTGHDYITKKYDLTFDCMNSQKKAPLNDGGNNA